MIKNIYCTKATDKILNFLIIYNDQQRRYIDIFLGMHYNMIMLPKHVFMSYFESESLIDQSMADKWFDDNFPKIKHRIKAYLNIEKAKLVRSIDRARSYDFRSAEIRIGRIELALNELTKIKD